MGQTTESKPDSRWQGEGSSKGGCSSQVTLTLSIMVVFLYVIRIVIVLWSLPQTPMVSHPSMSQLPPPPLQPPPLQHYQPPLHQSRQLPSSPFSASPHQLHSAPSMIESSNHQSLADPGARGAVPAGESLAGIPWKLNPPVCSSNSEHFRSFEKEALIFAEYVGFGHVLKDTCKIPVVDPSISYAQLRSLGFTDDEMDTHLRAYQFLRSAITSEVDRGILHRARFPTEAWRNLQSCQRMGSG